MTSTNRDRIDLPRSTWYMGCLTAGALLASLLAVGEASAQATPLAPLQQLPPQQSYGTHTFSVPAATPWVNTGLYLRAGQRALVNASGTWSLDGGPLHGPEGTPDGAVSLDAPRCRMGSLVARVGQRYLDADLTCVGTAALVTAKHDGILYLAANTLGDGFEWSDIRHRATSALQVTVFSGWDSVPVLPAALAPTYDYDLVKSGELEIVGEHIILTLPVETARRDAATIPAAIARMDAIYEAEAELRGKTPYNGQHVRFSWDPTPNADAMLAGNPIRVHADYVGVGADSPEQHLSRAGESTASPDLLWAVAHELGHDFSMLERRNWWMPTPGAYEGMPNILTVYAKQKLGLNMPTGCNEALRDKYIASGRYGELRKSDGLVLCMMYEVLALPPGWTTFSNFYSILNEQSALQGAPPITNPDDEQQLIAHDKLGWSALRLMLSIGAGTDLSSIFNKYHIATQ